MPVSQQKSAFLVRQYIADPRYGFRPPFHTVAELRKQAESSRPPGRTTRAKPSWRARRLHRD
jgi:hypothetical protein